MSSAPLPQVSITGGRVQVVSILQYTYIYTKQYTTRMPPVASLLAVLSELKSRHSLKG